MYPSFNFYASRPEETIAEGSAASSVIPTLGHVAMAHDQYRILAYAGHDLGQFNICFTDVATCAALGRLIEGPIAEFADLEAAETALTALLFHQNVEVFIPTIKVELNAFRTYARPDDGRRSQLVFDLFNIASTRDWLCAYDYVHVTHGKISRTERKDARLRFIEYGDFRKLNAIIEPLAGDVLASLALDFKVPGYFSDRRLLARYKSPQTFTDELYDRIKIPWRECVASIPGVEYAIELPPLLAIVLDRAKTRESIPDVLRELHGELGPVRHELYEFDRLVHAELDQAALERKVVRIKEAFIAIVPETRADEVLRTLARCWSLGQTIAKAYPRAIASAAIDSGQIAQLLSEASEVVYNHSGNLVDRTLSSRKFAGLLRTNSIHKLVRRHFSEAEISALERSR